MLIRFGVGQGYAGAGAYAVVELREETYLSSPLRKNALTRLTYKRSKKGCKKSLVDTSSGYGL